MGAKARPNLGLVLLAFVGEHTWHGNTREYTPSLRQERLERAGSSQRRVKTTQQRTMHTWWCLPSGGLSPFLFELQLGLTTSFLPQSSWAKGILFPARER